MSYKPGEKAMEGDIVRRLRGHYPVGPLDGAGEPEFGYRYWPQLLATMVTENGKVSGWVDRPPIMEEAAKEIERLRAGLFNLK